MVWWTSFQPLVLRTQPSPVPVWARPAPWSAPQVPEHAHGPRPAASNPGSATAFAGGAVVVVVDPGAVVVVVDAGAVVVVVGAAVVVVVEGAVGACSTLSIRGM